MEQKNHSINPQKHDLNTCWLYLSHVSWGGLLHSKGRGMKIRGKRRGSCHRKSINVIALALSVLRK